MKRRTQKTIGMIFWSIAVSALFLTLLPSRKSESQGTVSTLVQYVSQPGTPLVVADISGSLARFDPIFAQTGIDKERVDTWQQIGFVEQTFQGEDGRRFARLLFYGTPSPPQDASLSLHFNSGRLEDVVRMMLPAEKRKRIQQRLAAAMDSHAEEMSRMFLPLVQESIRRSLPVIEDELRLSISRHRKDIDVLAEKWNDEVIRERLVPLARKEVMPIVQKHGQPTAEEIGKAVWQRASLWRFAWRALYDRTPLPEQDLVKEEWQRFVQEEVVPVVEDHTDDIVLSVQKIFTETAANPTVRSELAAVASNVAGDREARQLVQTVLKEVLVENPRLQAEWASVWESPEAKYAIRKAGDSFEPVVRSIGDDLFGTRETGINPRFALVLRNQIFRKDQRWIVAQWGSQNARVDDYPKIRIAHEPMVYPVVYEADAK